jgi:hypothetical protein
LCLIDLKIWSAFLKYLIVAKLNNRMYKND